MTSTAACTSARSLGYGNDFPENGPHPPKCFSRLSKTSPVLLSTLSALVYRLIVREWLSHIDNDPIHLMYAGASSQSGDGRRADGLYLVSARVVTLSSFRGVGIIAGHNRASLAQRPPLPTDKDFHCISR